MQKFISVDWGTSVLRIRLVDANNMQVLAEVTNCMGISPTFDLWKQSGKPEDERLSFYQKILIEEIKKLNETINFQTNNLPIIISGMASSNIGMRNLPYKECPFSTNGNDLNVEIIEATNNCKHSILLVSGARTDNDVMRGEETQLIGSIDNSEKEEQVFILPGTHSKHAQVKNSKVAGFKTYMTGEFFELLTKKSILSNSVEKVDDLSNAGTLKSFEKGIENSLHVNILNGSFQVRTNDLFKKLSKQENYCYLSGLLIGTELKELNPHTSCTIVCDEMIRKFYNAALRKLNITKVKYFEAVNAVIKGHCIFFNLYKSKLI
ncbi:MAG TPA: 2-dehydro-3-deoxygalactonokinase [Chitinophagaceae bacterium]|nr:2-dehydro-3-deoxygalactonokinase [Chitinophagaceae bacterium]